jgi:hypothetical protein
MPDLFFTPPHRNRFVPSWDEGSYGSDSEPWHSMRSYIPRPVNIWRWSDNTLHENEQPIDMSVNTTGYFGGHVYGPLTDAEVTELTDAGYGAYLTEDPNPTPQP